MSKMLNCIILLTIALLSFSSLALGQDVEESYGFGDYIYGILYSLGPMLLFIVFLVIFWRKSQRGQTQYFSKVLPEYTKKHMEHMDQLIQRLDKLIEILEKK